MKSLRTPVQAPRANAIAERWVRTIRRECLDHVIPISERHLHAVLCEFVDYYNRDRAHRSLGMQPPTPRASSRQGAVTVRPVLGGLHHVYERVP
jgi:transposase InsO family protein